MFLRGCSDFYLITSFISLLNSSINGLPSYSFAAFLNFCINSSIIFDSCSTLYNSTIFIILLYFSLNSFLKILLLSHIPKFYFLSSSKYSFSKCLLNFSIHMTIPTEFVFQLKCLSYSS